jgi:uncharacterized protein YecT (DUF1311 family)
MRRPFLALLLLFPTLALALDEGDRCSSKTRLPIEYRCIDRQLVSCGGRLGYVACASADTDRLEKQMEALYNGLLKSWQRTSDDDQGRDFASARLALIKSQTAWEALAAADCDISDSLLGRGNAHAGIALDCKKSHLQVRIKQLKTYPLGH